MQKQNDKLKYDKFGFVDLTEKVKINDRGYLYFLIITVLCSILLGYFQPANALTFLDPRDGARSKGTQFEGDFSSPSGKLIENIRSEIKQDSKGAKGTGLVNGATPNRAQSQNKANGTSNESNKRPIHAGGPEQQQYIDYAWDISHDATFVYLLKAESGALSPTARSRYKGSNGAYDYGLCQINKGYHKNIVNDPRFLTDWRWQLDKCYQLYKGGTKFYGRNNIAKVKKYFTWTYD